MKSRIREILREELTGTDKTEIKKMIKSEFDKEFKKEIKSRDFQDKITDIISKEIKGNKKLEKDLAGISQKVIVQLYKTLWQRRNFWSNKLDNI